jgi:hypothetical protein
MNRSPACASRCHRSRAARITAACVALGCVQACRRVEPPTAEARVLAAIANVVTAPGPRGVCCHADIDRPLVIDVGSFARAAPEAFGAPVSKRQVAATLRPGYQDAGGAVAVRCIPILRTRCHVWHDGVYVRMESVVRGAGGEFSAFVAIVWPDRGLLGMARVRVDVRRRGTGWFVSAPTLLDIT